MKAIECLVYYLKNITYSTTHYSEELQKEIYQLIKSHKGYRLCKIKSFFSKYYSAIAKYEQK
jgi:hypothetical protein